MRKNNNFCTKNKKTSKIPWFAGALRSQQGYNTGGSRSASTEQQQVATSCPSNRLQPCKASWFSIAWCFDRPIKLATRIQTAKSTWKQEKVKDRNIFSVLPCHGCMSSAVHHHPCSGKRSWYRLYSLDCLSIFEYPQGWHIARIAKSASR